MSLYLIVDHEADKLSALASKTGTVEAAEYQSALKGPEPMKMVRGIAHIDVSGVLEPERVAMYDYYGVKHTAYSDISRQALQAKEEGAKGVQLNANSGGGNIEGMLPAMKTLRKLGIPTTTKVSGLCCSAMYMLASQTDSISSASELDILGSIGVVTRMFNFDFVKEITNSASPNKRPDINTEEGIAAVEQELDDIYGVVIPYVAKGRGVSVAKINSDWGKGGTMTAKTALARGMIDSINEPKPAGRSGTNKGKKMDINQLKAEHPDLYASVLATGKEAGKAEFKELAEAHLTLADASGATDKAIEDIKAGTPLGAAVYAFHQAEGIKRAQIGARTEEAPAAVGEGNDAQVEANGEVGPTEKETRDEYAAAGLEVEL